MFHNWRKKKRRKREGKKNSQQPFNTQSHRKKDEMHGNIDRKLT
jgi:hypothetical protein